MSTIGVAIAIPEPWGQRLQDYRTALGDATAALIPSHITLVPPVDAVDVPVVEEHLARAASQHAPFEVHLRGTGTFRPVSPVVFVCVVAGISSCEQLAADVRSGPLASELEFPYHPHVTVAHHLPDPLLDRAFEELDDFECRFEATDFHLYVHDEVRGWQVDTSFALGRADVVT